MTVPHGTASRYSNYGCRCDECREASSAARRKWLASLGSRPSKEIPHGTPAGYRSWGCRCDPCRLAASLARRRPPPREGAPGPERLTGALSPVIPHGTRAGWRTYRCRCGDCQEVREADRRARDREYSRARRARREAAAQPPDARGAAVDTTIAAQRKAIVTRRPSRPARDGTS